MPPRRLFRVLAATLVPVALLLLTELTLRALGLFTPPAFLKPETVCGIQGLDFDPAFFEQFFPPGLVRVPEGFLIPDDKSTNQVRIFVLGESAAQGDPAPPYAFSRFLDLMLKAAFPTRRFEVINVATTAINSHVLLPMTRELANCRGDIFIFYVGNNEVVGPYGPGTAFADAQTSLSVIRLRGFVTSTRIGQAMLRLQRRIDRPKRQRWLGMEMFLKHQVPADTPALQAVYQNFAVNYRGMVALASGSGARVLVCSVATNLRDSGPFASLHRAGLSPADLARWQAAEQAGEKAATLGSWDIARARFLEAEKIDDRFANLEFRIGQCWLATGDFSSARKSFEKALELDTLRFRADRGIESVIRDVGGANWVDVAGAVDAASPHGIPGYDLFWDHVHLTPQGNELVARTLFDRVAPMLAQRWQPPPSSDELFREIALTRFDQRRVAQEMLLRNRDAPFTNQIGSDTRQDDLRRLIHQPVETEDELRAAYRKALALHPDDLSLHECLGVDLWKLGHYQEAAYQFKLAYPLSRREY